jgi:hypothetical protein
MAGRTKVPERPVSLDISTHILQGAGTERTLAAGMGKFPKDPRLPAVEPCRKRVTALGDGISYIGVSKAEQEYQQNTYGPSAMRVMGSRPWLYHRQLSFTLPPCIANTPQPYS